VRAHLFCQLDDGWLLTVVPDPRAHASSFSSELARALSKLVNVCYYLLCTGACSLLPMTKLEAVEMRIAYRCKQTNFLLKILQVNTEFSAENLLLVSLEIQKGQRQRNSYSFGMFVSIFEFSSSLCVEE
jgi:hypothetical protein